MPLIMQMTNLLCQHLLLFGMQVATEHLAKQRMLAACVSWKAAVRLSKERESQARSLLLLSKQRHAFEAWKQYNAEKHTMATGHFQAHSIKKVCLCSRVRMVQAAHKKQQTCNANPQLWGLTTFRRWPAGLTL